MPRGFLVKRAVNLPLLSPARVDTGEDGNVEDDAYSSPYSAGRSSQYGGGGGVGSPDSGFSGSPAALPPLLAAGASYTQQALDVLTDKRQTSAYGEYLAVMATAGMRPDQLHAPHVDPATAFRVSQWQRAMEMLAAQSQGSEVLPSHLYRPSHFETASLPRAINALTDHLQHMYSGLLHNHLLHHQTATRALPNGAYTRHAAVRKLNFDENVSGERKADERRVDEQRVDGQRKPEDLLDETKKKRKLTFSDGDVTYSTSGASKATDKAAITGNSSNSGDIDSRYNRVEATPEARAELAKIDNRLGDYVCRLCTLLFPDAFELARHRCAGIRTVEYRCPECDKCFNCPANLASHRRWHKPRNADGKLPSKAAQFRNELLPLASSPVPHGDHVNNSDAVTDHSTVDDGLSASTGGLYRCPTCRKLFRRKSYLRKHALGACPALHKLQRLSTHDPVQKSWLTMSAHKPICQQNTSSSVRNLITSAASGSAEPSNHGVLFDDDKQQAHSSSLASGITGDDDTLHDVNSGEAADEYQRFFKKKFSALMGGVKCTSDASPKSSTPPSSPSYTSSSLNNVCHVMSNYRPIKESLSDLCT